MHKVLFVAGEASGDMHAAGVAGALRRLHPEVQLAAVGGPRLAEQGVELIHRDSQLGVMGFLEVLRHVPRHFMLLRKIRKLLERGEIALVILIDYPGFNMKAAEAATGARVPGTPYFEVGTSLMTLEPVTLRSFDADDFAAQLERILRR